MLYFKGHIEEYFLKKHENRDVTKEELIAIVRNNTVLLFLEQKMVEEEQKGANEDQEVDDEDDMIDEEYFNENDFNPDEEQEAEGN